MALAARLAHEIESSLFGDHCSLRLCIRSKESSLRRSALKSCHQRRRLTTCSETCSSAAVVSALPRNQQVASSMLAGGSRHTHQVCDT